MCVDLSQRGKILLLKYLYIRDDGSLNTGSLVTIYKVEDWPFHFSREVENDYLLLFCEISSRNSSVSGNFGQYISII